MSEEQNLFAAAENGQLSEALAALDNGANVNWQNPNDGATALHWAARSGHHDIVALLLEKGADPNLTDTVFLRNGLLAEESAAQEKAYLVKKLADEAQADLDAAIPILEAAVAALNAINSNDIKEVKAFKNPPENVRTVCRAVCIMLGVKPQRIADPALPTKKILDYWGPSQKMLGDSQFINKLISYDKDSINPNIISQIEREFLDHPDFVPEIVARASKAAAGLCTWVHAMVRYDRIVKLLAPKRAAMAAAEEQLKAAMTALAIKKAQREKEGETPLYIAARSGYRDIVALLLENGADPDLTDKDGMKPVDVARGKGHADIVPLLQIKWSSIFDKLIEMAVLGDLQEFVATLETAPRELANYLYPQSGDTLLHALCKVGQVDAVTVLLKRGSNAMKLNKAGRRPIDCSREQGHDKITALLDRVQSIYKIYDLAVSVNLTEFHLALDALSDATPAELAFLHPQSGDTSLHVLCGKGQVDAVAALLRRGVPINSLNKVGSTCLAAAILGGHYSVIDFLLWKGADISLADKFGNSAATMMTDSSVPENIRHLLEATHQCLVAARDGNGAESSSETLTQLFILEKCMAEGAIPNATKDGHNALGFALGLHRTPEQRRQENIAAVACLLSRNADLPSFLAEGELDIIAQPWSPTMKNLLEEGIQLKATGQVVLYRADLIVVGNGASGKTTLLHRIKFDKFLEGATMTDGIDMTHLRIGQVYFAGRDAAGQPIYAHTLSLFLKEDAIYLAVFNPRVENNVDALTQFLNMIQNSSPQARVVLATTRSDEIEMDDIMLADLRRRFPMICGVYPVDSFSGQGVDSLRHRLLEEALTRPSTKHVVSSALPRVIDRVMRYAEEHRDTFSLSRDQLLSILGEPDLAAVEQMRLVDQLVSFGAIYTLSSGRGSDPVFILRPQQLADVLACVVTKNPVTLTRVKRLSKEGILDHSDDALQRVWGMYPEALWRCDSGEGSFGRLSLFLRLLHDSGLAYEVFDSFGRPQGRSIIPCILPEKPVGFDGDVNNESELLRHFVPDYLRSASLTLEKLQISFNSMPFTFFAQLLAGLRKMATDGGAWRNGAVLSAGVSFSLLREERTGISISLFGKNRSVRSVILLTMLKVMHKFSSMTISDVTLSVGTRKWNGDDIEESLHDGHGVLHSTKIKTKVEVHSLWMLFPQESKERDAVLSPESSPAMASNHLSLLQKMLQRAKASKSMDFLVLINHYLQSCVPSLLNLMGAPRPLPHEGSDLPRPLWVVLKHRVDATICAMPFFPHYVPDEPWMVLEAANIPFTPASLAVNADDTLSAVRELLSDCFATMRGNLQDMLPSAWELALSQSLDGVDPDLMMQREKEFFVCVDGTVFSNDFAVKAQAMKTVSLGQKIYPLSLEQRLGSGSDATSELAVSTTGPASEGITVAAIRSFYENHVKGQMKADCTTADILPVVKRITKEGNGKGLSYCQLLRLQATGSSSDQVGAATVFISHAWKYIFYEFLLALEARFKGRAGMFLWIDNFSHNQHEDLTSDDWITKFEQHIVRINRTVMILFPWENPIPFTRAWCLLEVFYNTKNGVPFEVYLAEEQRRQFLDLAQRDPGQALLIFSRISTRQSTCWVLNDQLRIHSLIESSVGFEAVDQQVHQAIAQALKPDDSAFHNTTKQKGAGVKDPLSVVVTTFDNKISLVQWLREKGLIEEDKVPEITESMTVSFK